jgi:ABC-2 type transport system permease protein
MNTHTETLHPGVSAIDAAGSAASVPPGRRLHAYLQEIRCECLSLLRTLSFSLPTLLFPPMFYVLFAVVMPFGRSGGWQAAHYLLATYVVFGVMAPGLFGFGVTVAMDRERGWLRLRRVAPMPASAYLVAKLVMAMAFAAVIFAIMATIAATAGGVRLPALQWLQLLAVAVFGVLPFCAIGLFIGSVTGGQGAPAIVNLVYLPMAFLSGLWFPLMMLPAAVQATAPVWPAYHLGQTALAAIGQPSQGSIHVHVLVLLAITIVFFVLAQRRLAREAA